MLPFASLLNPLRRLRRWASLPEAARAAHRREVSDVLRADPGIPLSVAEAACWLERAQDRSASRDGGVARHFSLIDGWGSSYPETTGYIVPTIIEVAKHLRARRAAAHNGSRHLLFARRSKADRQLDRVSAEQLMARARRMLDWLVATQLPDGGTQGGTVATQHVVPVAFNTGQVLLGFAAGVAEFGPVYREALNCAATWLVDVQDSDGAWRKYPTPFAIPGEKTYDTHAAWGLFEAARVTGERRYADAAVRNVRWAIGKQQRNGWFADCCLNDPEHPLTHTLGYVLRGVLEGFRYTRDPALLESARLCGEGLLSALGEDGFLAGRLDAAFTSSVPWACLTGTCQIAHCWLLLFEETGHAPFLDSARRANAYVRRTIATGGSTDVRGAIRGSFPVSGDYCSFQYLSWAAKFFIDSNLLEQRLAGTTE